MTGIHNATQKKRKGKVMENKEVLSKAPTLKNLQARRTNILFGNYSKQHSKEL